VLALALLALGAAGCAGTAGGGSGAAALRPTPTCRTLSAPRHNGIAFADSVHALVVFVHFSDDDAPIPEWPLMDAAGRALPRWTLPRYAETLVEPDPRRINAADLSPADSSLSAYFFWQSRHAPGGPHVLSGEVWPQMPDGRAYTYVPQKPSTAYHNLAGGRAQRSGYGYLTEEILRALAAMPGFDPARFDATCDGVLDHLMLVIRRDAALPMQQGWAVLTGYYIAAGAPRRPLRLWSESRRDSVTVDWTRSGSHNLAGGFNPWRLLIHEYGHALWQMGHTAMITDNDVPAHVASHDRPPERLLGCVYNRMCGSQPSGTYDESSITLSGHEMRRAGWAVRTVLDPADGDRPAVSLRDLYRHGEVALVPLRGVPFADTLSLENRQRSNGFDAIRVADWNDPFYGKVFAGLGATGLLATLSAGEPTGPPALFRYDVLFADTSFAFNAWCNGTSPGCGGWRLYHGDTFHPDGSRQLSPWTRPNTSGLTRYRPGVAVNWFAIDDLRVVPGDADSTMVFDFVADARRGLTVRADSWMGAETEGERLGPIRVAPGATLTIEAGATLTFADGLSVAPGARLVVAPGATLRFGPGQVLDAGGEIDAEDATFTSTSPRQAWGGVVRQPGAQVRLGRSRVERAW
jgi:hypothetical protein